MQPRARSVAASVLTLYTQDKGAMKDTLVLLLLLSVGTTEVCSVPYYADSGGNCRDPATEYKPDDSDLCCKKCSPGYRLKEECSGSRETECEPCKADTYSEKWNYASNCLSCMKCKPKKGLQTHRQCNTTQNSKCICNPGKFCELGFDRPYCTDCRTYTTCKPGFGVTGAVELDRDVKCERCLNGTYLDKDFLVQRCRTTDYLSAATTTAAAASSSTRNSTRPIGQSVSGSPRATSQPDVAITAGVVGSLFLFVVVMLLLLLCKHRRKGAANLHPKVDANGNCETVKKVGQNPFGESQMSSAVFTSPEHECLLVKEEAGWDQRQCSDNNDNFHKLDDYTSIDCISRESMSALQSTLAHNNVTSALSEPMTLLSNTEPFGPQSSIPTQCSSQPTSPQIISPVTNSPHVNVNITLHIGNGSCGSPPLKPTDLSQAEFKLPFGQEEESFSNPEQEAGNSSKMSVPETVYCNS